MPDPRQKNLKPGIKLLVIALAATILGANALASDQGGPPRAAKSCFGCHGSKGISNKSAVPHLAGQHEQYLAQAMEFYRTGERNLPTMRMVAQALSEEQIAVAVNYYAGLPRFSRSASRKLPPPPPIVARNGDPFAEVRAATEVCAGCHGEDGNTDVPGIPRLAGQHVQYLGTALNDYRNGGRSDETMAMFGADLSDTDIEDIAAYYVAMEPRQAIPPENGDPYAGRAAAEACAGCHGVNGNGQKGGFVPHIAGMDGEAIVAAIQAYKLGARSHEAMQEAVANLSDETMADLAAYYATRRPVRAPGARPRTQAQWVETCNRCHGPAGDSADPRFPVLAGQSEVYLIEALKSYHLGGRENSLMSAMSYPMREQDIRDIAAYYASQITD